MRATAVLVLGSILMLPLPPSLAQQPSLEELERQLKAKEADQAAAQRRAAEARRRAEAAEARRRQEEAEAEARRRAEAAAAEERRRAEEVATALPGFVFRDLLRSGGEGPAMVIVPSGRFEQGSPSYEGDRDADEGPVRTVQVQKVALGRYEVTRGEFRRFVEATGYQQDTGVCTWRDPGFSQGDDHPVVCVSWNDAKAHVEWLSRETGKGYRLPSESEQEYVIRAGTVTPWPWGSPDAGCSVANYRGGCNDGHEYTSPVGSFRANAFGLYDTSGNVWEWSEDCHNSTYSGAPTDGRAWVSGDCTTRVLRGGSWYTETGLLRSAYRYGLLPANRLMPNGFRLARTL